MYFVYVYCARQDFLRDSIDSETIASLDNSYFYFNSYFRVWCGDGCAAYASKIYSCSKVFIIYNNVNYNDVISEKSFNNY